MSTASDEPARAAHSPATLIIPLALAQFISSFAGSNLNVMVNDIQADLDTTVKGIQTVITVFLLVMSVLMIPASKLTDRWGRKNSLIAGLALYAVGAILSAVAPNLGILILGNSILEGIGTALLIPPVYILATLWFREVTSRAWAFGVISGAAGIGAAAGPLLGGLIATAFGWRIAFVFQAVVVLAIILLTLRVKDPLPRDEKLRLDVLGSILLAVGLSTLVLGVLNLGFDNVLALALLVGGIVVLALFFVHIRFTERRGGSALLSMRLFTVRSSNLALVTQNVQWLVLNGASFVVSVFLQTERGYSPITTGLIFTSATVGMLITSISAAALARRFRQRTLIIAGFVIVIIGVVLVVGLVARFAGIFALIPGLLFVGLGIGTMLTPSVNVVQSSFSDELQAEISGVSRSVSNLGSAMGTAFAGTILVALVAQGDGAYGWSMLCIGLFSVGGLIAAIALPRNAGESVAA